MSQYQVWEVPEEKPKIEIPVVCLKCGSYVLISETRCRKCGARISEKTVAKDLSERYRILQKTKQIRTDLIVLGLFIVSVLMIIKSLI